MKMKMKTTFYFLYFLCWCALVSCGEDKTNDNQTSNVNADSVQNDVVTNKPDNNKAVQKVNNYGGKYIAGNDDGILTITDNGTTEVEFYIATGGARCTGELKGKITIDEQGKGAYSDSICVSLNFHFNNNEVKVTEKECDYHGMMCMFDGTYKKRIK